MLHLPTSVGQNAWHLARGERAIGLDSTVLVYDSTFLKYPADIHVDLGAIPSTAGKSIRLLKEFLAVRSAYDVFHFNWGTSLLTSRSQNIQHLDLPFYPKQARLFVTYNGCDARQKYPTIARGGISACRECGNRQCLAGKLDGSRAAGIQKMARHVEHMWALNPDLMHFLPPDKASFLPYAVAVPIASPRWPGLSGPLKVVHAPTNRDIKGTHYLLDAVERLNGVRSGSIELTLVEGVSHAEALEQYLNADVVVDQLLIGWYGGFAVEAMLLGKAVIVRINRDDLRFVPSDMAKDLKSSVISSSPGEIYETLIRCLEARELLMDIAKAGYSYARRWHDPSYVASLTLQRYHAAFS